MFAPYSKAIAGTLTTVILTALAAINITPGMTVEELVAVVVSGAINFAAIYFAPRNTVK